MITSKDIIIERIQNYLYSFYAKDIKTARKNEIYDCLCRYLMEIIGTRWVDTKRHKEDYEVYILSFEYLPGRFLENIIYKLDIEQEIRQALSEIGFDYETIISYDPEPDLGIGDMGIGSSFLINALTNQKIKTTAYALRYESGNFKQIIEGGKQVESSYSWLRYGTNWEHKKSFTNIINIYGRDHKTVTYDMPVVSKDASFINTLRLFKSDSTLSVNINEFSKGDLLNAYDDYINNSSITEFLYVDDSTYEGKMLRLKQEYFFSASAMRDFVRRFILYYDDIRTINKKTDVVINDIHPTLALIEFIRILTDEHNFTIKEAITYTREIFHHIVFSTTDDSFERYPIDEIRKMNKDIFETMVKIQNELAKEDGFTPFIVDGLVLFKYINMALSKDYIFLSKILSEDKKNSKNVCYKNIGTDRFLYSKSANIYLDKTLLSYYIDITDPKSLRNIEELKNNIDLINDLELIKYQNKLKLIKFLGEGRGKINPHSIFDMQLSIMHESKRQILNAMAIAYQFYYLRDNANAYYVPRTYVFSGKANEGYFIAKETIKFIFALKNLIESDKIIREKIKIIFVEDLSVGDLRYLYPAADVYSNLNHPLLDNQNFNTLNALFNMSNLVTSRGGITENVDKTNDFYFMGDSYLKIKSIKENNFYNANDFIYQNEIVKYTTERLLKESYEQFPYDFKIIYNEILMYNDSFNVFYDLKSLIYAREKISKDYLDKEKWVKQQISNIIWANEFDMDYTEKRKLNFDK